MKNLLFICVCFYPKRSIVLIIINSQVHNIVMPLTKKILRSLSVGIKAGQSDCPTVEIATPKEPAKAILLPIPVNVLIMF
jgi:hypothetical protein